jgi:RNA polymerase sigma-70 factor (ECF subfamily)
MDEARTDQDLLRSIASRDIAALEALASRYERPLLGLARAILDRREDLARDVVQDCWLRVVKSAGSFRGDSAVKTWLYRIVINRSNDVRARWMGPDLPVSTSEPPPALHSNHALESFESQRLRAAVSALPSDRRMLLLLCYHQNLTLAQAADILGLPLGTVKSRLHTALQELRSQLGEPA